MTPDNEETEVVQTGKTCVLCDKALAVFGLVMALGLAYIAIDLLVSKDGKDSNDE